MLLDKLEQAEIETRIVDQYHYIRIECQYVLFTEADITKYSRKVLDHLHESHKSQITDMLHYMPARSCHFITTPAADISLRITGFQGLDEVRPMQVA